MHALLGFKDLKYLNNIIDLIELESLKLNFKNAKCLITDKASVIIAKLLLLLDTYLCLITNCNERFEGLFIILSSDFMQLPLSDNILTKVTLQYEMYNNSTNINFTSYRDTWLVK